MDKKECELEAVKFLKAARTPQLARKAMEFLNSLEDITDKDAFFTQYEERMGFKCHFARMAQALSQSEIKPHTLVVLQCPKETQYGITPDTVTGVGLLSLHQPIQEAIEEVSPTEASTVFCIEACCYCPALVEKRGKYFVD
jgi:hypothetical protein